MIMPIVAAGVKLNGGASRPFYVEQDPDDGVDWVHGYKATPAELRCREQGEFCVEIDAVDPELRVGQNDLEIRVRDAAGRTETKSFRFQWDPEPLPLPLDLRDLRRFAHIQEIGQIVNGAFDLDRDMNLIRSRSPVAPDALLVLGSPHAGQEATYAIRFPDMSGAKWLGCSDFFAGMTEGVPWRGIRVGWCSAGMAAFSPNDGARSFIAWGDHSRDPREWAIATNPAKSIAIQKGQLYRVRHQIALAHGLHRVRWRNGPRARRNRMHGYAKRRALGFPPPCRDTPVHPSACSSISDTASSGRTYLSRHIRQRPEMSLVAIQVRVANLSSSETDQAHFENIWRTGSTHCAPRRQIMWTPPLTSRMAPQR
jgi:hypothetical protein